MDQQVQSLCGYDLSAWANIATIGAAVTALVAIVIGLLQYVGSIRSQDRGHMHAVFRDYLEFRAGYMQQASIYVTGYKFYAMEEVFYWVKSQRKWRYIPFRMSKKESEAWCSTVEHHCTFDAGEREYFSDNLALFGIEFRDFVSEINGPAPATETPAPAETPATDAAPAAPPTRRRRGPATTRKRGAPATGE